MQLSIISTAFSLLAGVELCLGSLAVTFVARFQFAHGEEKKTVLWDYFELQRLVPVSQQWLYMKGAKYMSRRSVAKWLPFLNERHATASQSHLNLHLIGAQKEFCHCQPNLK